jgi:ParB-like chromosome segregation protein Spo0J
MSNAALDAKRLDTFRIRVNDPNVHIRVIDNPNHPEYDDRVLLPVNPNMVESLRICGQKLAAVGYKADEQVNGKQVVVLTDGRQRWKAMNALWAALKAEGGNEIDFPTFQLVLERPTKDSQKLETALVTNVHRTGLSQLDLARRARAYLESVGDDRTTRTRALALLDLPSLPALANLLALVDASQPVQDAVADGRLSPTAALHVAKLPSAKQKKLVADLPAEAAPSVTEVRKRVAEAQGKAFSTLPGRKVIQAKLDESKGFQASFPGKASEFQGWIDALAWVLGGGDKAE